MYNAMADKVLKVAGRDEGDERANNSPQAQFEPRR
jgi:hypothetical protein